MASRWAAKRYAGTPLANLDKLLFDSAGPRSAIWCLDDGETEPALHPCDRGMTKLAEQAGFDAAEFHCGRNYW